MANPPVNIDELASTVSKGSPVPPAPKVTITHEQLADLLDSSARTSRDLTLAQVAPAEETKPQKYLTLDPKVAAGGIAFNISVVVFYVLEAGWAIEPPAVVAAAATGLVTSFCAWLAPRARRLPGA